MELYQEIIKSFVPEVIKAGRYARQIQPKITANTKTADNFLSEALTNADLSVQNALEVFSLARFPTINFIGEEHQDSLNQQFFDAENQLTVFLDPIDGTYCYTQQTEEWAVMLSLVANSEIQGAIAYMPLKNSCYWAVKDIGTHVIKLNDEYQTIAETKVELAPKTNKIFCFQSNVSFERLNDRYEVFEILELRQNIAEAVHICGLLDGRLVAAIGYEGQVIDWGAAAFLVEQAGGVMSTLDGSKLQYEFTQNNIPRVPSIIASCNTAVHEDILQRNLPSSK